MSEHVISVLICAVAAVAAIVVVAVYTLKRDRDQRTYSNQLLQYVFNPDPTWKSSTTTYECESCKKLQKIVDEDTERLHKATLEFRALTEKLRAAEQKMTTLEQLVAKLYAKNAPNEETIVMRLDRSDG